MKKTAKFAFLATTLGTSLLLLTGCSTSQKSSTSSQTKTLNVTMGLSEDEWKVMRQDILPDFEKQSGIKVNAIQMESADVQKKLEASAGANKNQIDVIAQDLNTTAKLVNEGLMRDLTADRKIIPAATYAKQKSIGVFGGKTYFLPYRPNVEINYYNQTKFKEYNLQPPKNWDELLNVAKTFQDKEQLGRVGLKFDSSGAAIEIVEFIRSAGGDPLILNDKGSITAFTYLQKLWPYLSPDSQKGTFSTTNTFLAKDEVYYMPNWPFATNIIVGDGGRKDILADAGFAGPKGEVKTLGGEVLGITKSTTKTKEALTFIKYMESKAVQKKLLEKNGWPSFREDVTGAITGWQKPYYQATDQALKVAEPLPNVLYWADETAILNDVLQEICVQRKEIKPTLDKYAQQLKALQNEAK